MHPKKTGWTGSPPARCSPICIWRAWTGPSAVGRLDLTFVVVVLMPLVLLLLTFDTLSRERESGRLALLVVHCPRHTRGTLS